MVYRLLFCRHTLTVLAVHWHSWNWRSSGVQKKTTVLGGVQQCMRCWVVLLESPMSVRARSSWFLWCTLLPDKLDWCQQQQFEVSLLHAEQCHRYAAWHGLLKLFRVLPGVAFGASHGLLTCC